MDTSFSGNAILYLHVKLGLLEICCITLHVAREKTEQNRTNMSNACQKFIVKLAHQKFSLNSINYHTVCNSDSCVSSKL